MKKKLLAPMLFAALAAFVTAIQAFLPGSPFTARRFSLAGALPLCLLFLSAFLLLVFFANRAQIRLPFLVSTGAAFAALIWELISYLVGRFDALALAAILFSALPFAVFFIDSLTFHKPIVLAKTFAPVLFLLETVGVIVILAQDGLSALLGHPRFILFLLSIALSLYYFLCFPRVQKLEPLEDLPMPGEEEGPLTR